MADKPLVVNPFEPENFATGGGGLWDNKVVTILKASAKTKMMGRQETPWINPETGTTKSQNGISIIGLADDLEFEREEFYTIGQQLPTEDGEGFIHPRTKQPAAFSENSNAAKFAAALKESGFDVSRLWDEKSKRIKLSGLVGAQFLFKGIQRLDKEDKPKMTKKGFPDMAFFPVKFIGYKAGVAPVAVSVSIELREKASAKFLEVLEAAPDNKLTRVQAIKGLNALLTGDPDANKIIALLGKPDFHTEQPWKVDSTGYSL